MQQKELARRLGIPSQVIPNVLDFETPPPGLDDYNRDLRHEIGLRDDDWFILQPTRVVQRKGIEHAIELVRRLKDPRAKLVISHPAGDEGNAYMAMLNDRIADAGIDVRFIADRVGERRGKNAEGKKVYTLSDVYPHADLVTYPSHYEGFGNAFLEAVYFGKPVVVNTYAVYARDIDPLGFKTDRVDPTRDQGHRRASPHSPPRPGNAGRLGQDQLRPGPEILLLRRGPPKTRSPSREPVRRRRVTPGSA